MKLNQNPLAKSLIPSNNTFSIEPQSQSINLSDMPDFLYPEKDQRISELFVYLTQTINWKFFSLNDIYLKQENKNGQNFEDWKKELESTFQQLRNRIINSINKSSKLLVELVEECMKFLNYYFKQYGEKVRVFIFLEYFLRKLEPDKYIINTDNYCRLYKLYIYLCRDWENIFEYLDKNKILVKNELFNFEKGYFYERIHKFKQANQIYIEGFVNILDDKNPNLGKLILDNYKNFEMRMNGRIERDIDGLGDDLEEIDGYMHKEIENYKIKSSSKIMSGNKKSFVDKNSEENMQDKLIKNITCNFSLKNGKLEILDNMDDINGTEIIGEYGDVKFIKNPPAITKVSNITYIYEFLKNVLSICYTEWKEEYESFDLNNKNEFDLLPYSWISELRPTKRNIKNLRDNNTVLNIIQKEYMNAGSTNINNNDINSNINANITENVKNISHNNSFNEETNENNNKNDHEISNMLSDILFEDKNEIKNNNINNKNNEQKNVINDNMEMNNTNENKLFQKDTNEILQNLQYQLEHPPKNNSKKNNSKNNKENTNQKPKSQKKVKKNKFKHVGTLNFDQNDSNNTLIVINLCNENDQKIEVMQSASKLLNNERDKKEEKKPNKKYIITLDNISRRNQYIKEKTSKEKKIYDKKKEEMLQGINFDYLNSFKKLFETYPELNNLLETDQLVNQNKKVEQYKLNLKDDNNKLENENIIEETNIQRESGPSQAMKLLLEVYGIPPNFIEENNPYIEYAKENGIKDNSMFENIFKDIKSYISAKNSKKRKNIFQSKNNNININNKENSDEEKENKENVDDDGDLIIESESEDNNDNNNKDLKEEIKNESKKKNSSEKKESKHIVFDSKRINQITYIKNIDDKNEKKDEFGKLIEDINKKAEKGIKIGEKLIFSNYKGMKEHSLNKKNSDSSNNANKIDEKDIIFKIDCNISNIKNDNDVEQSKNISNNNISKNSLVINKSIELTVNKEKSIENKKDKSKEKEKEEKDSKFLITNSKISTDIFMNALNYNNNNIFQQNKNRNNSKKNKNEKLSKINMKSIPNSFSNSLSPDKYENNYYTEVALYSRSKKSKSKESKLKNISSNEQIKVNNFKIEKGKGLSSVKENISLEKEKSSKIENKEHLNEKFWNNIKGEKSNVKNYDANIGNIHDLDNFDDLFK